MIALNIVIKVHLAPTSIRSCQIQGTLWMCIRYRAFLRLLKFLKPTTYPVLPNFTLDLITTRLSTFLST